MQFSKPNVEIKENEKKNEMFNILKPEQINGDKKSNEEPDISKIKNDIFPYGGFDLISLDKSENSKKTKRWLMIFHFLFILYKIKFKIFF